LDIDAGGDLFGHRKPLISNNLYLSDLVDSTHPSHDIAITSMVLSEIDKVNDMKEK